MRTTLNQLAQKFQQQDLKITVEVARNLFEKEALTRAVSLSLDEVRKGVKSKKQQVKDARTRRRAENIASQTNR